MLFFTKSKWNAHQYTGRWDDNPYNHSRVDAGELPEAYIGRRNVMVHDPIHGTSLLTEGFHFIVDDEEGWDVPWHEEFYYIEAMFRNGYSCCIRTKRDSYDLKELEDFVAEDAQKNGGFWYAVDWSEADARRSFDFSDFENWPVF